MGTAVMHKEWPVQARPAHSERATDAPQGSALRSRVRGGSFVEVVALIVIVGVIAITAAPGYVNSRTAARDKASQVLAQAIATATEANYQRYRSTGSTEGVVPVEQCDPATFVKLVGGTTVKRDESGGLLVNGKRTYLIATASPAPHYAGGIAYCVIADVAGGSPTTFAAVTCPPGGACAP